MKFLSMGLFWLSLCAASAITVWPPQANQPIVPANAQEVCLQKTREGNLLFSSPGHNLSTKPVAMELEAADWRYLKFQLKSAPAATILNFLIQDGFSLHGKPNGLLTDVTHG